MLWGIILKRLLPVQPVLAKFELPICYAKKVYVYDWPKEFWLFGSALGAAVSGRREVSRNIGRHCIIVLDIYYWKWIVFTI